MKDSRWQIEVTGSDFLLYIKLDFDKADLEISFSHHTLYTESTTEPLPSRLCRNPETVPFSLDAKTTC